MMIKRVLMAAMVALATSLTLTAPNIQAAAEVRMVTQLTGAPIIGLVPKGFAEFRSRVDASRFKVQVQNVNLPPGTVLNVLVDNASMGLITLSPALAGELQLNSKDGATLPSVAPGTTVVVTHPTLGTILAGVF